MRIGEVSKLSGISISAIRFYEDEGLLPRIHRTNGKRDFSESVIQVLKFIKTSQEAGFSLLEIKGLVSGFNREVSPSKRWRDLASAKIQELDALIERAISMKDVLRKGLSCECLKLEECIIIPVKGSK